MAIHSILGEKYLYCTSLDLSLFCGMKNSTTTVTSQFKVLVSYHPAFNKLSCYSRWKGKRCPTCNQKTQLFSKIFIDPPPPPTLYTTSGPQNGIIAKQEEELLQAVLIERDNQNHHQAQQQDTDQSSTSLTSTSLSYTSTSTSTSSPTSEREERKILLDMRTCAQQSHAVAIVNRVKQNAQIRKLKRELRHAQEALELTREELESVNHENLYLRDKLNHIQVHHWQRHQICYNDLMEQHEAELDTLRREIERTKITLSIRDHQLAHCTGGAFAPEHMQGHSMRSPSSTNRHQPPSRIPS